MCGHVTAWLCLIGEMVSNGDIGCIGLLKQGYLTAPNADAWPTKTVQLIISLTKSSKQNISRFSGVVFPLNKNTHVKVKSMLH